MKNKRIDKIIDLSYIKWSDTEIEKISKIEDEILELKSYLSDEEKIKVLREVLEPVELIKDRKSVV